jgi:Tfp pilus assembly protein FimT
MILSLLFAVSWPFFNRAARQTQLETTCKEILYTLRYARDCALNEGTSYCVSFDVVRHRYWLGIKNSRTDASEDFVPLTDSLHKIRSWPGNIYLDTISDQQVVFGPDGTSRDFSIAFKTIRGNTCTLTLQGSTGNAVIGNNV